MPPNPVPRRREHPIDPSFRTHPSNSPHRHHSKHHHPLPPHLVNDLFSRHPTHTHQHPKPASSLSLHDHEVPRSTSRERHDRGEKVPPRGTFLSTIMDIPASGTRKRMIVERKRQTPGALLWSPGSPVPAFGFSASRGSRDFVRCHPRSSPPNDALDDSAEVADGVGGTSLAASSEPLPLYRCLGRQAEGAAVTPTRWPGRSPQLPSNAPGLTALRHTQRERRRQRRASYGNTDG